jgi:hypothetical protein
VTVVEVLKGRRKVGREQEIDRFLASLPKLELFALDTLAAGHAGRIYGDLERLGQPIGRADPPQVKAPCPLRFLGKRQRGGNPRRSAGVWDDGESPKDH